jgi:hypothetical protein
MFEVWVGHRGRDLSIMVLPLAVFILMAFVEPT